VSNSDAEIIALRYVLALAYNDRDAAENVTRAHAATSVSPDRCDLGTT
jgi:hypothetical protein